ncbi:MAG: hypothetical protein V2B19_10375 [Pseudomonadota bacterium]
MIPLLSYIKRDPISSDNLVRGVIPLGKRSNRVLSVFLLFWTWMFMFMVLTVRAEAVPSSTPLTDLSAIEQKWGVQIISLRQTAGGQMLDFRYRVVDAEKAAPLFDRKTQPYVYDKVSKKSLAVPNMAKIGTLRTSNMPQSGRTYWMFFGNPGIVKPGGKVSVVIGEFRAEDILVQ